MSFVVAAMKPGYSIVAGDTQLNDDNGALSIMGIKVFPIDACMVIGFTGNYIEGRAAISEFMEQHKGKKDFLGNVSLLSKCLKTHCKKGNVILVETKNDKTWYAILSDKYNWKYECKQVLCTEVKTLLPDDNDDVNDEYCRNYINSEEKLRSQIIDCIKAVSHISRSVNDKVFGFEMNGSNLFQFTEGVSLSEIDFSFIHKA